MAHPQRENGHDGVKEFIVVDEPYILGNRNGEPFILCTECNLASFNENDIKHKYCGNCHRFHEI